MTQEEEKKIWNDDQLDYVKDLLNKAKSVNEKTYEHHNCMLSFRYNALLATPMRIDDIKLLYIGSRLLPNMLNYLVNILPQFLYPYVVAYLQNLSEEDNVITINDLYDLVVDLDNAE